MLPVLSRPYIPCKMDEGRNRAVLARSNITCNLHCTAAKQSKRQRQKYGYKCSSHVLPSRGCGRPAPGSVFRDDGYVLLVFHETSVIFIKVV